jgi:hypothetical protein
MPCGCPPKIRRAANEAERVPQRCALQKDRISPATTDKRQDHSRVVINRLPQPALVTVVPHNASHLIDLGVTSSRHGHGHGGGAYGAPQGGVDRRRRGVLGSEVTAHGIGTDPSDPCRLTDPTGLEAHVHARVLPLGHTPCAASVALCVTVRVATFHDLLMMTMRALDRDACQRPPLPAGHCQAEAQCDITLSPSPRVEHSPLSAESGDAGDGLGTNRPRQAWR